MKLTKDTVAKLTLPPGRSEHVIWDDDISGFGVRLRPHSATFVFRYRHGARQPRVTIGNVSAISIAQARAAAAKLYARVKLGEDPAGERSEARERAGETFELALRPYLLRKQAELRPGSFENVQRHLLKHAAPLHRLSLTKAADRRTLASLITKIATDSGPVEANSAQGSLSGFFVWAIGQGLIDGVDPTAGIPKQPTNGPRARVPSDAELVKIWNALCPAPDDFGDIVRLLTLTLCRLSEIGSLDWNEVDFTAGVIRLPATRTKAGVARDVPMSPPVRRILEARNASRTGRALVFGVGQGGFSGWSRAKRDLDTRSGVVGWTLHDLRRYGSTRMNDEAIALPHIIEACLGHAVARKAERHYNWSGYQEQVKVALDLWGDRVMRLMSGERKPIKVATLRRRKGA
jgi:integrase